MAARLALLLLVCAFPSKLLAQSDTNTGGHSNRALRLPSFGGEDTTPQSPFDRLFPESNSNESPSFPNRDSTQVASRSPANAQPEYASQPVDSESLTSQTNSRNTSTTSDALRSKVLWVAGIATIIALSVGGVVHWLFSAAMRSNGGSQKSNKSRIDNSTRSRNSSRNSNARSDESERVTELKRQIALRFDRAHVTPSRPKLYQSSVPLNLPTRRQLIARGLKNQTANKQETNAPEIQPPETNDEPNVVSVERLEQIVEPNSVEDAALHGPPETLPPSISFQQSDAAQDDSQQAASEQTEEDMAANFAEQLFRDNLVLQSQLSTTHDHQQSRLDQNESNRYIARSA